MSNNRSIDKEAMYKKLMPSAANKEKNSKTIEAVRSNEHSSIHENSENSEVNVAGRALVETLDQQSIPQQYFKPKVLVNIAEVAVRARREEAMKKFKCCTCDRCIKDVTALAVNNLPPKYVVVYEEEVEKELQKYDGDVVTALVNAIVIVKNHPRH